MPTYLLGRCEAEMTHPWQHSETQQTLHTYKTALDSLLFLMMELKPKTDKRIPDQGSFKTYQHVILATSCGILFGYGACNSVLRF